MDIYSIKPTQIFRNTDCGCTYIKADNYEGNWAYVVAPGDHCMYPSNGKIHDRPIGFLGWCHSQDDFEIVDSEIDYRRLRNLKDFYPPEPIARSTIHAIGYALDGIYEVRTARNWLHFCESWAYGQRRIGNDVTFRVKYSGVEEWTPYSYLKPIKEIEGIELAAKRYSVSNYSMEWED